MKIRLQKYIAESGYCSRRKAEELIEQKRVKVNNKFAILGMQVKEKDVVTIEGKIIKPKNNLTYIVLNKPRGYVCTSKDITGEKNVFSLVKTEQRLFVVGRLDKDSRGLVLLTNDGDFAYKLTHPSFSHEKEYKVKLSRNIDKKSEELLKEGVDIKEKTKAKVREIEKIGLKTYRVVLTEGKRRQIRRMFEVFNCTVQDLQRVRIDKYKLGRLREKEWAYINK